MSAAPPAGPATPEEALRGLLRDGMTIGIGGFGLDRKPLSLVETVAQSKFGGFTIETYAGGVDIELLVAAGKIARLSTCHVGIDQFGLAPLFRAARESGQVAFEEWSEGTQLAAWRAAADHVPFAAVIMDRKSELLRVNPNIRIAASPFGGEDTVVVKAPKIDLALLHAEAAHPEGWAIARGDAYLDTLLARAADKVVLTAERWMGDDELEERHRDVHLLASYVDRVLLSPGASLPGSCMPDYLIHLPQMRAYADACAAGGANPERLITECIGRFDGERRI